MQNVSACSLHGLNRPAGQELHTLCRLTNHHLNRSWLVLGLWLTLLSVAASSQAANPTFKATIKNASNGTPLCLAFQNNGYDTHPSRLNWGDGQAYCGYTGGKEALINNRQAVWTFESLGNDQYIIYNASRGEDECLTFGQDGQAQHPDRFRWSYGPYCGMQGGADALLANRQAVWKVEHLRDHLYTIKNASQNGTDECLIFSNNGHDHHPQRHNWGSGPYCGMQGGQEALIANGQAVFEIERLPVDDLIVPQAWRDGYLVLQSFMYPNQRLHVGHDGNGRAYLGWGDDDAFRWKLEPIAGGNFFYLRNVMHSQQRLHVGHNGNGVLYASSGDDDAYQWTFEPSTPGLITLDGATLHLRNKKYPDQRIGLGANADFSLSARQGTGFEFQWQVHVLPTVDAEVPGIDLNRGQYRGRYFRLENRRFSSQRLHAGHDGNGLIYTGPGDDLVYIWQLMDPQDSGYYGLKNAKFANQWLRVDSSGSGTLTAAPYADDPAFQFRLEPVGQHFTLTSRLDSDQRIQVSGDGSGHAWAGTGNDDVHQWSLRRVPVPPPWVDRAESCRTPGQQEVVMRVCFYEEDHQSGRSWCNVLSEHYSGTNIYPQPGELPQGVGLRARSVSTQNCNSNLPSPTVMVYDELGQRSDTAVIKGNGQLGPLAERVRSFFLVQNPSGKDANYVCLYKGDNQSGAKHCRPFEKDYPALNLSPDFNDQVRSVGTHTGWLCNRLRLWRHYDQGGQVIAVSSNQNLKDHKLLLSWIPWVEKPWSEMVSTFEFKGGPGWFCND